MQACETLRHEQVKPENGPDFENVWKNRDSKLLETPGFIRFALLKGDEEGMASCLHRTMTLQGTSAKQANPSKFRERRAFIG